jgi:hypothetical protein
MVRLGVVVERSPEIDDPIPLAKTWPEPDQIDGPGHGDVGLPDLPQVEAKDLSRLIEIVANQIITPTTHQPSLGRTRDTNPSTHTYWISPQIAERNIYL